MVEGIVEGSRGHGVVNGGSVIGQFCRHEIDSGVCPEWDSKVGKVYVCKFCGEKIYTPAVYFPPLGKKLRVSKKERRRQKALQGGSR